MLPFSCPHNACSRALSSKKVSLPWNLLSSLWVGGCIHSAIMGPASSVGNVLLPFLPALALSPPGLAARGQTQIILALRSREEKVEILLHKQPWEL